MSEARAAIDLLRGAQRVILVTHKDPDGDAIGTLLGLGWALRAMGKQVTLACDDGVPWLLDFLPGSAEVVRKLNDVQADLVVVVDCSDTRRMGQVGAQAAALGAPLMNIDHHATNTHFGQINVVDPEAVSAAELAFEMLEEMGYALDTNVATCLLTGIVTDTRGFRTANVTQNALRMAVRLMDAGASLADITQKALDRRKYRTLAVLGRALGNVRQEDRVIWSAMSRQEWGELDPERSGARPHDFSTILNTVEGAKVAAFFSEMADSRVDVSMRAKPGFDLTVLFGEGKVLAGQGGGHALASGAEIAGPLEEAADRVVWALKALVEQQDPETPKQIPVNGQEISR
jgi:phosphoesterase RecJ-like protein